MTEQERKFDLASFQRAKTKMIATNDAAYSNSYTRRFKERIREYTQEEVEKIISSGSITDQQRLSRNYFYKDGFYKQIIFHYATILKYSGLLIPNPSYGKNLSTDHIQKRYFNAVDYLDRMSLPTFFTNCAIKALVDGCYYGLILQADKKVFSVLDLPCGYCRTRFKDLQGNDIIEFDVSYFNTIIEKSNQEAALALYPELIRRTWRRWKNGKITNKWVIVPSDIGICFPFFDSRPMFLNIIPALLQYNKAVQTELERDAEEIRKIVVQKIPHMTDGRLLFEPDEAEVIHSGTVGMLKGNKNVSVLTTYADVDAIVSKTANDAATNVLSQMMTNIYSQAGVSSQIFASTGSSTLASSIKNDISLMMYLANKFAIFVTNIINRVFANSNINFKYVIFPISEHNREEFITSSFKLAGSGYSYLIPGLASGLNQKELGNVKDLENDVLLLGEKLRPLSSSYTQSGSPSGNPVGRPRLADDEKADKTIQNEESLDNQTEGGSNE